MILQTICALLNDDTTLQTLLGGEYVYDENSKFTKPNKYIAIDFTLGGSHPSFKFTSGDLFILIFCKRTVTNPRSVVMGIVDRVLTLINKQDRKLDDGYATVHFINKDNGGPLVFNNETNYFWFPITFRYTAAENYQA